VVSLINENDSFTTEELSFRDNGEIARNQPTKTSAIVEVLDSSNVEERIHRDIPIVF